jgi:hypothetical protein
MPSAPVSLAGMSLQWTGVHHSEAGDFAEISTHTVTYETETTDYVTASGKLVGQGTYEYVKLDDQVAVVTYRPEEYRGKRNVILHAIFDFSQGTDRAVLEHEGRAFAVADGTFREVVTPPRPPEQ